MERVCDCCQYGGEIVELGEAMDGEAMGDSFSSGSEFGAAGGDVWMMI